MPRLSGLLLLALLPAAAAAEFRPDPRTVQRHGAGYRYPQAGWIVLHVEGQPYERGVQHGRLLAPEIAAHVRCYARVLGHKAPEQAWKLARTLCNALFLRGYPKEYLEEMKGIADGASAAGARFDGRRLDLLDVVVLNAWSETETLDDALDALPNGLEGIRYPLQSPKPKVTPKPMHCSAFAATGPATRDGKVVFGHITMFDLYPSSFYNVWLDVKPAKGHRVLMQTYPGGIQSGLDYYLNDRGLLVCETTIAQTRFERKGAPLVARIRQALQYADTIDGAVELLKKGNNGLYTNEWLLADVKTSEIALFALGTHTSKLYRSSKGQWFGGTKGFYWGCNNTKDLEQRLETVASVKGKPASVLFVPSERDRKWVELYDRHRGKIDADFGKLAFTTPPLAAFASVDAKVTTTGMATKLQTWALFGPPLGRTWEPSFRDRKRYPEVRPLVSNPWTVLHPGAPDRTKLAKAPVDLHDPAGKELPEKEEAWTEPHTEPAWHGTILPRSDADLWLAAAFPAYERLVALENGLKHRSGGALTDDDRERLAVALHEYRARYELGARARPEAPLSKLKPELRSNAWHRVAEGKGVLLLHALRGKLGGEVFDRLMDDFGRAHAGKEAEAARLVALAEKAGGKKLDGFFAEWLQKTGLPAGAKVGGPFTVVSFYPEVEQALIVYGTRDEAATNREAAQRLRQSLRRRRANFSVPIKADRDVQPEDLKGRHLLLVGRPDSNPLVDKVKGALPVGFGPRSFSVGAEVYAHPDSAVLAAAESPFDRRYSVVVVAGLGGRSTRAAAGWFADRDRQAGEVVVLGHGKQGRARVVKR